MIIDLKNHTILITGASSGIGRETAIMSAAAGATLIITGRSEEKLTKVFSSLKGTGHKMICADLTDENEINKLVKFCGQLDGLVHCAGIIYPLPVKFIRKKHIDEAMHTNFDATVLLTSLLIKEKRFNEGASLVFMSSISTKHPYFGGALYVSSKAAVEAYAKTVALELCNQKIRANILSPALVKTEIFEQTVNASGEKGINDYEKQYPLGFGETDDVASLCIFLLSKKSKWITGQNIIMDGGLTLGFKK